jgi:hypothetical protein
MRKAISLVCLSQLIFVTAALAQANRATITGEVRDPSGGLVPGAEVSATNVDTGVVTNDVSNSVGVYSIRNLFPGHYTLTCRKSGFESFEQRDITLQSTQVAQINIQLQVGATSQSVTVTANAPVIEKEEPTVGTNMNGNTVTDLPLSIYSGGRFVEDFAVAITPGYSPYSSPYGAVINGGQYFAKDYTVDGTTATANIPGDSMETGPSMEAVEELQAQTSGLDAQDAITSGGVIQFNLKSGTNQLHGTAFNYGTNEVVDANTWTNDSQAIPKGRDRRWDFGGSLGGPIIKNKTFFFGAFERYTQTDFRLGGYDVSVPTTQFLQGNFSALLNTSNVLGTDTHGNPIYQGAIFNPADPGAVFVGNQIPTSMFSSVSQKINAIFAKDYAPQAGVINDNERFPLEGGPAQTPNRGVIKLDHNLSTNDRLSGSLIMNNLPVTKLDSGGVWEAGTTDGGPLSNGRVQLVKTEEWRVSESHTISPNLLNVANLTYNWEWNGSVPILTGTNWNSQLGFGNTGADNFPVISFGSAVNGYGEEYIGNAWQGYFFGTNTVADDTLTWIKGHHSFTFGGEFRAYQVNSHAGSGALSFNFNPNTTSYGTYEGVTGFGFASYLLGDVSTASETTPFDLYGRQKMLSLFAQDRYMVTPKLTLNLGLRWQYIYRYHEKYGHWANFDLNAIDPTLDVPGTLTYLSGGGGSFDKNEYWNDFGPQIGFAYAPWNKWVFRGSFGLIFLPANPPFFSGVPNGFAPGFQGTNTVNSPFDWDSGYPGVFQPGNKNVNPESLFGLVSVSPDALMGGFNDVFNIGAQYELTPNMRLEVAYVGNRGHHLPDSALAWDEPSSSTFLNTVNANPGINPYNDYIYCTTQGVPVTGQGVNGITCPYNNFYGPALAAIAPYPQIANWSSSIWYYYDLAYVGLPLAKSYYDSMVVDLVKRAGPNLSMDLNYTLSRQERDTYTVEQDTSNSFYTPVQDFANLKQATHALSGFDQENIVKGYVLWQLPFGRRQHWLPKPNRILNAFVGGWTLGGLVLYDTGQPMSIGVTNIYYPLWGNFYPNWNLTGYLGHLNPKLYQAPTASNPSPPAAFYIPPNVASSPIPSNTSTAPVQLGNGPPVNGALRCPGTPGEDASLLKNFTMGTDGRFGLQFRAEFYNLFNRHTYAINGCAGVGTTIGTPTFAQVTGVNSNPRMGQFAIRFSF